MADERPDQLGEDAEITRLLRERLTRHPAPPHLRAAVMLALRPEPPRRRWWELWFTPALSALATAMIMLMLLTPALPVGPPPDSLGSLTRAVSSEHSRTMAWGGAHPELVSAALPRIMDESGVVLNWVFAGDDDIRLIDAQPAFVEGHRAM